MPPKMVTCCICKHEVSKRKSLAWGEGRACREHKEVQDMVREKAMEQEQHTIMAEMNDAMRYMMAVSFVRVYHTMLGIPVSILMMRVPKDIKAKVRKEVEKRGAIVSDDEFLQSMFLYGGMRARAKRAAEVLS